MEELNQFELLQALTKPLTYKPSYTVAEKRIFAWSIVWEGTITINEQKPTNSRKVRYQPTIELSNTEFDTLETFHTKIAKIGTITPSTEETQKHKPSKKWRETSLEGVAFLLNKIAPHIRSKRKRKVAYLVLEFCVSRIEKHEKAKREHTNVEGYSQRERELVRKVKKLNKIGL